MYLPKHAYERGAQNLNIVAPIPEQIGTPTVHFHYPWAP